MARSFQQWKAWASARLLEIAKSAKEDKVRRDADILLTKLQYLRLESLPSFLVLLHAASQDDPSFLDLATSAEEVEAWFREQGEDE